MNVKLAIAGSGVLGLAVGFAIGVKATVARLQKEYQDRLDEEVKETRSWYEAINKPYATAAEAGEALLPEEVKQGIRQSKDKREPVAYDKIASDVKVSKAGDGVQIYQISQEEFMTDDDNSFEDTLTWYSKDGILADSREVIVEDPDATIGAGMTDNFNDALSIYVKNEKLQARFEILFNDGSYRDIVAGPDADDAFDNASARERMK